MRMSGYHLHGAFRKEWQKELEKAISMAGYGYALQNGVIVRDGEQMDLDLRDVSEDLINLIDETVAGILEREDDNTVLASVCTDAYGEQSGGTLDRHGFRDVDFMAVIIRHVVPERQEELAMEKSIRHNIAP